MSELPATISDVGTRETTRSVAHAATDGLRVRSPAWIYDNGCDVAATCNTAYTAATAARKRPCLAPRCRFEMKSVSSKVSSKCQAEMTQPTNQRQQRERPLLHLEKLGETHDMEKRTT